MMVNRSGHWLQKSSLAVFTGLAAFSANTSVAAPVKTEQVQESIQLTGLPVVRQTITDSKAVFATARSSDKNEARARISGTLVSLNVDEGSRVKRGDLVARIVDKKIRLKMASLDAKIRARKALMQKSKKDLGRGRKLKRSGVITTSRLDELKTTYNVNLDNLKSAQAERAVLVEQMKQGDVLAPSDGRVLKVSVTKGSVVMPGESLVSIAANNYILRLQLPERHARFIKLGDKVVVGARGLDPDEKSVGTGTIIQIYPELKDGRLIADVKIDQPGNYFVGERTLVRITAERRKTIVIPKSYTFKRYGLDYVRLERSGHKPMDIIIQLGSAVITEKNSNKDEVEVLSGLKEGDHILMPKAAT